MALEIQLSKGQVATIDDIDWARVAKYRWHSRGSGAKWYAARCYKDKGKVRTEYMHRLITDAPMGAEVDHVSGDSLDNRRCNLRVCTLSDNRKNRLKRRDSQLPYKGVTRNGRGFSARITVNGKRHNIAYCHSAVDAAVYYNVAAQLFHGSFASLNNL